MKKSNTTIEKLTLANGKILVERTENSHIYRVVKIAKNVNYEALGKPIELGDLVVCDEYMYSNSIKLKGKDYFITKPKAIAGYFAN